MRRLLAPLAALAIAIAPAAFARPLTADEAQALEKVIGTFGRAMDRGDAERIVDTLPPRVLNFAAAQSGMEIKVLQSAMIDQTKGLLKDAKFSDFAAPITEADAQDATAPDGKPVVWTILRSSFKLKANDQTTLNEQPLVAVNEDGAWYLMRIEAGAEVMLGAIYPFLKDVQYPAASQTPAN